MSLLNQLTEQLSGPALEALSKQLGADPSQTQSAIAAALPMIVGAMGNQAATEQGAQALQQHVQQNDGSILDNLTGFLGSTDNGIGPQLIESFFGGNKNEVHEGITQVSGLNAGQAGSLLENLAPVVMGMMGRQNQQGGGLDIGSLVGMFMNSRGMGGNQNAGGGVMGMLNNMLDSDRDGSAIDDVAGMLGGFLKK
jgi:hypothetical protein